jgi:hypothetical protein
VAIALLLRPVDLPPAVKFLVLRRRRSRRASRWPQPWCASPAYARCSRLPASTRGP